MSNEIISIEKGTGEGSTFFKVRDEYQYAPFGGKICEIKESKKCIRWDAGQPTVWLLTYKGFDAKGMLLFEIEANSSLTVTYNN